MVGNMGDRECKKEISSPLIGGGGSNQKRLLQVWLILLTPLPVCVKAGAGENTSNQNRVGGIKINK